MSVPALIQAVDQLWTIASSNPGRIAEGLGYLALTAQIAPPIFRKMAFACQLGYVALQEKPSKAIGLLCRADDYTQGKLKITKENVKLLDARCKIVEKFRDYLKSLEKLEGDREDLRKVELLEREDQLQSPVVRRVLQEKPETRGKLNASKLAKELRKKIKEKHPDLKDPREINRYAGALLRKKGLLPGEIHSVLKQLQRPAGAPAA